MRKRMMIAAVGALLEAAGFAGAQDLSITFTGTSEPGPPLTLRNVELEVNGFTVRADRAVAGEKPNEFTLEGNVRVTLPRGSNFRVTSQF